MSYDDHKKILHEEMLEWKIAWRTSFLIAWKTNHVGHSFRRCLTLIHATWFEILKTTLKLFSYDYHVKIKETWLDKFQIHFGCIKRMSGYLIIFIVPPVTWIFNLFWSFKMEEKVVHCVPKGLKHLIDELKGYLICKNKIAWATNKIVFLWQFLCCFHIWDFWSTWRLQWIGVGVPRCL